MKTGNKCGSAKFLTGASCCVKPQTLEDLMSDKEKLGLAQGLGMIVLVIALAVLTLPLLHLIGVHEILMNLSTQLTNMLFHSLGVPI